MTKILLVISIIITSLIFAPLSPSSFGHGEVDQSFEGPNITSICGTITPMEQSFTPTKNNLIGVDIGLIDLFNNPAGTYIIEILDNSEQVIGSTSDTRDVAVGDFYDPNFEHFDFDSPISLIPGDPYILTVLMIAPCEAFWATDLDNFVFRTYFLDTPPDTTITKAVDGKNVTPKKGKTSNNNIQFSFTGTDESAVSGFKCSLDGGPFLPCTSPYSYTLLPQGAHNFQVIAIDDSGNADPTPAQYNWFITSKTK